MSPVSDDAPDETLLAATRTEPTAFGAFYRRHEDRVLGYFLARVGDPEVAADLTAETFAAALTSAHRFRPRKKKPAVAWLFGIARNQLAMSRRQGRVEARARRRLGMAPVVLTDEAIERIAELGDFAALVPVSARTSDGVDRIRDELLAHASAGPALYPVDATSGDPVRLRIAELVREAALNRTREEVPHAVAVLVDELVPATRRSAARVTCDVLCDTESQKGILVGKGGAMIRAIGADARPEIERLLDAKVMLELTVRVRKGWRDDDRVLDQLGP